MQCTQVLCGAAASGASGSGAKHAREKIGAAPGTFVVGTGASAAGTVGVQWLGEVRVGLLAGAHGFAEADTDAV